MRRYHDSKSHNAGFLDQTPIDVWRHWPAFVHSYFSRSRCHAPWLTTTTDIRPARLRSVSLNRHKKLGASAPFRFLTIGLNCTSSYTEDATANHGLLQEECAQLQRERSSPAGGRSAARQDARDSDGKYFSRPPASGMPLKMQLAQSHRTQLATQSSGAGGADGLSRQN